MSEPVHKDYPWAVSIEEINEFRRECGQKELTGPIDFRPCRRVLGPLSYTFEHVGAWSRTYNKRRRPIRRQVRKVCR